MSHPSLPLQCRRDQTNITKQYSWDEEGEVVLPDFNDPTLFPNKTQLPCPLFSPQIHSKFLMAHIIQALPLDYISLDPQRVVALHFAVIGIDVLGQLDMITSNPGLHKAIIDWIYSLQLPSLGFCGSPLVKSSPETSPGHLAATYSAVCLLKTLGDDLSRVNIDGIINLISSCIVYIPEEPLKPGFVASNVANRDYFDRVVMGAEGCCEKKCRKERNEQNCHENHENNQNHQNHENNQNHQNHENNQNHQNNQNQNQQDDPGCDENCLNVVKNVTPHPNSCNLPQSQFTKTPLGPFYASNLCDEFDVRFLFCAMALCDSFNLWEKMEEMEKNGQNDQNDQKDQKDQNSAPKMIQISKLNPFAILRYITSCQTYEGGFNLTDLGQEAHGGATHTAVVSYWLVLKYLTENQQKFLSDQKSKKSEKNEIDQKSEKSQKGEIVQNNEIDQQHEKIQDENSANNHEKSTQTVVKTVSKVPSYLSNWPRRVGDDTDPLTGFYEPLPEINTDLLDSWLLNLQGDGYRGRTNKARDCCYTYWLGSLLQLCGLEEFSQPFNNVYFVSLCENTERGGFGRDEDGVSEILHTFYAIAGMSLLRGYNDKNEYLDWVDKDKVIEEGREDDGKIKKEQEDDEEIKKEQENDEEMKKEQENDGKLKKEDDAKKKSNKNPWSVLKSIDPVMGITNSALLYNNNNNEQQNQNQQRLGFKDLVKSFKEHHHLFE